MSNEAWSEPDHKPLRRQHSAELDDLRRRVREALAALNAIEATMLSFPAASLLARAVAVLADEEPAGQEGK